MTDKTEIAHNAIHAIFDLLNAALNQIGDEGFDHIPDPLKLRFEALCGAATEAVYAAGPRDRYEFERSLEAHAAEIEATDRHIPGYADGD